MRGAGDSFELPRSALRLLLACWLCAATAGCTILARPVESDLPPALAKDQGVLVVHLRTDRPVADLRFGRLRVQGPFGSGEHLALVVAPAGRYRLSSIEFGDGRKHRPRSSTAPRFAVRAGRVNFVGMIEVAYSEEEPLFDLVPRTELRQLDRTALALARVERDFPELLLRHPPVYTGNAPHVFLDHYVADRAVAGVPDRPADPAAPDDCGPDGEEDDAETSPFFREPEMLGALVSPGGSTVATWGSEGGIHRARIRRVGSSAEPVTVLQSGDELALGWVDDDDLLVHGGDVQHVVTLYPGADGPTHRRRKLSASGMVIDLLPNVPDRVLWSELDLWESRVHRVPLSELIHPTGRPRARPGTLVSPISDEYQVGRIRGIVAYWISDGTGTPRAALVVEDTDPVVLELRYRESADASWRTVGSWSARDGFPLPVGMTPDGADVLVLSAEGRDTKALRAYRVEEEKLGEVLWADDRYDPVGVVWDDQGDEVAAVVYEEAGLQRHHYLDGARVDERAWLEERFPDSNVTVASRTRDGRLLTLVVSGPRDPGSFYLAERESDRFEKLGSRMPWLDPDRLSEVEALRVRTNGGLEIDAFLTLPRRFEGELPPLVVMPHGGPIGISDTRDFDPTAQYLAAEGYAVLQPNYRGSRGRGTTFLDAGRGAWGDEIEDDIAAALARVLADGRVDPERICIAGFSYGGYSALISATRRPQPYRCAVAIAAPSDLLLMFDSSDFADTADGLDAFAEIVGDPDLDRTRLVAVSPAYRAADIDVPVLLVHGGRDRRVDLEHAQRMRAMLELWSHPLEWMVIDDMSHDPERDEATRVMARLRDFLDRSLSSRETSARCEPAAVSRQGAEGA